VLGSEVVAGVAFRAGMSWLLLLILVVKGKSSSCQPFSMFS